jgi:hypothetical protein
VEKCGIGNGSRFRPTDNRFALRAQGRYRERHRDAVITEGIDFGPMECLPTGDSEAVLALINVSSHPAQVRGERCDAIGFFDAQLSRIAHFNAALGVRSDCR